MTIVCTPDEHEALVQALTKLDAICVMPDTECPGPVRLKNYKVTCKECLVKNVHWVLTDVEPNIWPACPVCGDNELEDENDRRACKQCHAELYENGVTVTINANDNKSNVSERRKHA